MTTASPIQTTSAAPALGHGDYLRFNRLVQDRCGLHFPEKRRADLERGVRQAFAASTCADLNEYYRLLQDPDNSAVHFERLVNALTVSETHFFRDTGQINALYQHVLPQLIRRQRPLRTMRIWSAGCASGEEPYSIAMLLRELLPDVDEWSITILGTDINTEALDRARQAVYSEWAFREEWAKRWRSRYFRQRGNFYELIPAVQRMVTFRQLNLKEGLYPSYETNTTLMDLILCRNVMIYLTPPTSRKIVERFYDCLTQDGWLVVGHAEHSLPIYHRFQVHNFPDAILYQRTDGLASVLTRNPAKSSAPQTWEGPRPTPSEDSSVPASNLAHSDADATPPPVSAPVPAPPDAEATSAATGWKACPTSEKADAHKRPAEPESATVSIHELQRLGHVDPLERAKELLSYGRSEEARDLLLKLVKASPDHAPICTYLGQAYANLGCWEEATHWCRRAIGLDRLALEAYYTLALVLQHQGQLDEAIAAMKKVVYIDQHNVLGHYGLADLYRSNGQLAQALKSLDNARRLLEGCADDEFIPGSGGIMVGRLRDAIIHQQQKWRVEASGHQSVQGVKR